jgi:hypothetical protein
MRASRSRSIVLLLDCCYGGAFSQGVTVRASGDVNVLDSFPGGKLGGGRDRAVITASSAMEYAFEGDQLADDHSSRPSVFTSALVEGLATGDADRDQDGWVSLTELYDYVFDRVRDQNPHQTPSRDVEMQGELYVARRSRPVTTPAPLPPELQDVIDHPLAGVRAGAVQELARLLQGRHAGLALAAKTALERLAHDDSHRVQEAAAAILTTDQSIHATQAAERAQEERARRAAEQASAERARLAGERAEQERAQRAAEQARAERAGLAGERAEQERAQRAAEQAWAEQARAEAERAEQERVRQQWAAQQAWAWQTHGHAVRSRQRSTKTRLLWIVGTTLWASVPLATAGLLTPATLLHIAIRVRRGSLWTAFALSVPLLVAGLAMTSAKSDAVVAVGAVFIMVPAAATTILAFVFRSKVFPRRAPNDGSGRPAAV